MLLAMPKTLQLITRPVDDHGETLVVRDFSGYKALVALNYETLNSPAI